MITQDAVASVGAAEALYADPVRLYAVALSDGRCAQITASSPLIAVERVRWVVKCKIVGVLVRREGVWVELCGVL